MEVYLLSFVVVSAAVFVAVVDWWAVHLFGYLDDCHIFASCHLGIASCHKTGLVLIVVITTTVNVFSHGMAAL